MPYGAEILNWREMCNFKPINARVSVNSFARASLDGICILRLNNGGNRMFQSSAVHIPGGNLIRNDFLLISTKTKTNLFDNATSSK